MSLFALAARTWNRKRHHFYCHFIILPFIWPLCNFCIGPMEATDFTDTRIQSRALTYARSSREPLSNTSETIDVILLKKFPKSFFCVISEQWEYFNSTRFFFSFATCSPQWWEKEVGKGPLHLVPKWCYLRNRNISPARKASTFTFSGVALPSLNVTLRAVLPKVLI